MRGIIKSQIGCSTEVKNSRNSLPPVPVHTCMLLMSLFPFGPQSLLSFLHFFVHLIVYSFLSFILSFCLPFCLPCICSLFLLFFVILFVFLFRVHPCVKFIQEVTKIYKETALFLFQVILSSVLYTRNKSYCLPSPPSRENFKTSESTQIQSRAGRGEAIGAAQHFKASRMVPTQHACTLSS